MSDTDRLTQIEARLDAATSGPWSKHDFGHPDEQEPSSIIIHAGAFDWEAVHAGEYIAAMPQWDAQEDDDADLIANAPADLRWLIDRLRETERQRDEWRQEFGRSTEATCRALDRAENAEARLAGVSPLVEAFRNGSTREERRCGHDLAAAALAAADAGDGAP